MYVLFMYWQIVFLPIIFIICNEDLCCHCYVCIVANVHLLTNCVLSNKFSSFVMRTDQCCQCYVYIVANVH